MENQGDARHAMGAIPKIFGLLWEKMNPTWKLVQIPTDKQVDLALADLWLMWQKLRITVF